MAFGRTSLSRASIGVGNVTYADFAALAAATVPASVSFVVIGGVDYKRVAASPGHVLAAQDASGAWFEHNREYVTSNEATDTQSAAALGNTALAAYKMDKPYHNYASTPHYCLINPTAEAFEGDNDRAHFTKYVAVAADTEANFALYHDDIKRYNAIKKAFNWYLKSKPNVGILPEVQASGLYHNDAGMRLQLQTGIHRYFGLLKLDGADQYIGIKGKGVQTFTTTAVKFDPLPTRGADWYEVTQTLSGALSVNISVGSTILCRNPKSSDPLNDNLEMITGSHIVKWISGDGTQVKYDIYDARKRGALTNPVGFASGTGANGLANNSNILYFSGLTCTGGFLGGSHEAAISAWYGAVYDFDFMCITDDQDPAITGNTHSRAAFASFGGRLLDRSSSSFTGGMDAAVRWAHGALVRLSASGAGGVNNYSLAGTVLRQQALGVASMNDVCAGGAKDYVYENGGAGEASVQDCRFANAAFGHRGVSRSNNNIQQTEFAECTTGSYIDGGSDVFGDTGTRFRNCVNGIDWEDAYFRGNFVFEGVTTNAPAAQDTEFNGGMWKSIA